MILLEGVTKKFGSFTAVEDLNLKVEAGELFGFLGPNGAGKTTTIKMITGLLQPTSGRLKVAGFDLNEHPEEAKRRLGFIPDRPFLYEKLTADEFLAFIGGLWRLPDKTVAMRSDRLLELFELVDWRDELIESYSHGMRQKLVFAAALIHEPEVIVVDEPMVGLDPTVCTCSRLLIPNPRARGTFTYFLTLAIKSFSPAIRDSRAPVVPTLAVQ